MSTENTNTRPSLPSIRDVLPEEFVQHPASNRPASSGRARSHSAPLRSQQHQFPLRSRPNPSDTLNAPELLHSGPTPPFRRLPPSEQSLRIPSQSRGSSSRNDEHVTSSSAPQIQAYSSAAHGSLEPAKHPCTFCSKTFSRPSSLRTHLNSHTGEKPFVCPVESCGRKFSVLSNMRRHLRTHTEE